MTDRTCQKWFAKFRAGDFSLDDAPRSGRPVEVDSDQIETLIENNQCYYDAGDSRHTQNIQIKVENHLHQLGYVNRFDVWVPHKQKILLDRISTCNSLLKHNENVPFFFFKIFFFFLMWTILKVFTGASLVAQWLRICLPANAGDTGSSPGLGRSHMQRSNWAREPQLLSLCVWSLCSATIEATTVRGPRTARDEEWHPTRCN